MVITSEHVLLGEADADELLVLVWACSRTGSRSPLVSGRGTNVTPSRAVSAVSNAVL